MKKKILMVISKNNFRDEEYVEPRRALEDSGVIVNVASFALGEAVGMFGESVDVDFLIDNINVGDFDGIVFVGGGGIVPHINDETLKKLAIDFYKNGKIVSAICAGPAILANAGILNNKKATIYGDMSDILIDNGASYSGSSVEVDGNVITADGPLSALKFGEAIVENLE